ncbi:MAG: phosphoglucosamine mutase [Candidatus Moranbacteria bacterium]|nr:phosphoglucosamine mutase [Candidatus Moranbacteria bacterium]
MSLMISVSGIRGIVGEDLTPKNIVAYVEGFAAWIGKRHAGEGKPIVILGRDTRPSGDTISSLVARTLALSGIDVIDLGIATTPTVELAVTERSADGGIIVTASHNPIQWNALKLLNSLGEFLDPDQLADFLSIVKSESYEPAKWDGIGTVTEDTSADEMHIGKILGLPFVDTDQVRKQGFRVLVDAVEGAGSEIIPELCTRLGVSHIEKLACGGSGIFPRNPEPIIDNLAETVARVKESDCDFGIIVDPDVDRLALVQEDGTLFGEEYTLVSCADFYLRKNPGTVVNNLSSSRALRDIAGRYGQKCVSARVGEANVVAVMKEEQATIGGEGNGGIILPALHYGRDALVGVALFVQAFSDWREGRAEGESKSLSDYRKTLPIYEMAKKKLEISIPKDRLSELFETISAAHPEALADTRDGLKLDFPDSWVHLRSSNTEPIIRIYTEAKTTEEAESLAEALIKEISALENRK